MNLLMLRIYLTVLRGDAIEAQFQFSALRTQILQAAADCSLQYRTTAIGTHADMRRFRDNIPWGGPSLMANKPDLDKSSFSFSLSFFISLSLSLSFSFPSPILISTPFVHRTSYSCGHSSLVDIRIEMG